MALANNHSGDWGAEGREATMAALEGEAVGELGLHIARQFARGVTFPLGYANGQGLYLPTSDMLPQGGYEVVSFWEYGFPAQLGAGFEDVLTRGLRELRDVGAR